MSWGTDFKTDIYLDRITFKNSYELDKKIEEVEQSLYRTKQLILMYCSSNPKDVIPEDWQEESLAFIHSKVDDLILQYEEDFKLLINLNYYKYSEPFKQD